MKKSKKILNIEDVCYWGRNFDENNNRLPNTEYILLKDLRLDHIKNIKKFFRNNLKSLNSEYLKYFNRRIKDNK